MRLLFTGISFLFVAVGGTYWWIGESHDAQAVLVDPGAEVPIAASAPRAVVFDGWPQEAPAARNSPRTPRAARGVGEDVAEADWDTEAVVVKDPGDFIPDPGPVSASGDVEVTGEVQAEASRPAYVDPDRSGDWVERLLGLYERVRE
jgi:hypothetical protein